MDPARRYLSRPRRPGRREGCLVSALEIALDDAGAHYGLGAVLADNAEFALAVEHLRRSLAGNSSDVQVHIKLSLCLLELGRAEEALEHLRAAVGGDPRRYGSALKLLSSAGRGRFWLRPSVAKKMLS